MEKLQIELDSYAIVSIAKLETGICVKYKKKDQNTPVPTVDPKVVYRIVADAIRLTTDLFNCTISMSEKEMEEFIPMAVKASESITITSRIIYLKTNTILTVYMNVQEGSDVATGYYWQLPVKLYVDNFFL